MRRGLEPAGGLVVLAAALGCDPAMEPAPGPAPAVQRTPAQAAEAWAAAHAQDWTLVLDETDPKRGLTRPDWSKPCPRADSPYVTLRYKTATTEIDLAFRCPVGGTSTFAELAAAFSHAVLESLPHGIDVPNWKFTIRTPSSSIDRDVRIAPLPDGRLEVLIDTPLFAISGHSQESGCIPLADSRSAPGCYVRLEHRIPLHLTLKVPFDPRSLD